MALGLFVVFVQQANALQLRVQLMQAQEQNAQLTKQLHEQVLHIYV
jgi:hypothetical protein